MYSQGKNAILILDDDHDLGRIEQVSTPALHHKSLDAFPKVRNKDRLWKQISPSTRQLIGLALEVPGVDEGFTNISIIASQMGSKWQAAKALNGSKSKKSKNITSPSSPMVIEENGDEVEKSGKVPQAIVMGSLEKTTPIETEVAPSFLPGRVTFEAPPHEHNPCAVGQKEPAPKLAPPDQVPSSHASSSCLARNFSISIRENFDPLGNAGRAVVQLDPLVDPSKIKKFDPIPPKYSLGTVSSDILKDRDLSAALERERHLMDENQHLRTVVDSLRSEEKGQAEVMNRALMENTRLITQIEELKEQHAKQEIKFTQELSDMADELFGLRSTLNQLTTDHATATSERALLLTDNRRLKILWDNEKAKHKEYEDLVEERMKDLQERHQLSLNLIILQTKLAALKSASSGELNLHEEIAMIEDKVQQAQAITSLASSSSQTEAEIEHFLELENEETNIHFGDGRFRNADITEPDEVLANPLEDASPVEVADPQVFEDVPVDEPKSSAQF